jgi:hypothetical protein
MVCELFWRTKLIFMCRKTYCFYLFIYIGVSAGSLHIHIFSIGSIYQNPIRVYMQSPSNLDSDLSKSAVLLYVL